MTTLCPHSLPLGVTCPQCTVEYNEVMEMTIHEISPPIFSFADEPALITCKRCGGSGEITVVAGSGDNARKRSLNCPECAGALDAIQPIRSGRMCWCSECEAVNGAPPAEKMVSIPIYVALSLFRQSRSATAVYDIAARESLAAAIELAVGPIQSAEQRSKQ